MNYFEDTIYGKTSEQKEAFNIVNQLAKNTHILKQLRIYVLQVHHLPLLQRQAVIKRLKQLKPLNNS
jgi:hypothetical protein